MIKPTLTKAAALLFTLHLVVGLFLVKDYGVGADDNVERITSIANYVHVMGSVMRSSENEGIRKTAEAAEPLMAWKDRYYGTALQCITVAIEHINGFEMDMRDVYLMRHTFVFLNFFLSGIFFYLILRRRYGNTVIPLLGALFYILYPRFFGESFYNIKDILFFSWCIIAGYFILRWLEDEHLRFIFPAAFALAIAANTRVLGFCLLLLACAFVIIRGFSQKKILVSAWSLLVFTALTFVFYVAITPFLWEAPFANTIETFRHFADFEPWDMRHLYLGEWIDRHIPWHYLPVWMGVTIPLLYIVMFFGGFAAIIRAVIKYRKTKSRLALRRLLYDLFSMTLFLGILFGYIILGITMYEGWRHAYAIFFPFLYIAVRGLHISFEFFKGRQRLLRAGFSCIVAANLGYLLIWNVINHPYQYVFFNAAGRTVAQDNFALDYWHISYFDLIRWAFENDDREKISFFILDNMRRSVLSAEEQARAIPVALETDNINFLPILGREDYYIMFINSYNNSFDIPYVRSEGLEEAHSISVDGIKIAVLYKRAEPDAEFDSQSWDNIISAYSSTGDAFDPSVLHDGNYNTLWTTGEAQKPGDFLLFMFNDPVDYNYVLMDLPTGSNDAPGDLYISVSMDGQKWTEAPISVKSENSYRFEPEKYRFIRLANIADSSKTPWSVAELTFGRAK
ncbi:MAG: hypothetical protein FWH04_09345 [Oscillospiraceae bacterium]|nr:hypothetical protein [Oscillospiraceae bacterium]